VNFVIVHRSVRVNHVGPEPVILVDSWLVLRINRACCMHYIVGDVLCTVNLFRAVCGTTEHESWFNKPVLCFGFEFYFMICVDLISHVPQVRQQPCTVNHVCKISSK